MDKAVFVTAAGVVIGLGVWHVTATWGPVVTGYVLNFVGG